MEHDMETTGIYGLYKGYIEIVENKMETTIYVLGLRGLVLFGLNLFLI